MTVSRLVVAFVFALVSFGACSGEGAVPTGPGVVVNDVRLPVAGAEYRGSNAHLFFGGSVSLTCGGHGTFSNAVEPPLQVGGTGRADYSATFTGQVVLQPPAVRTSVSHTLNVQAAMAETFVLTSSAGGARVYDTELVTFELGDAMPDDIRVRESPTLASAGTTTVTSMSDGRHRVESHYDVWLEISLDGGQSWTPADAAVRMTLESS